MSKFFGGHTLHVIFMAPNLSKWESHKKNKTKTLTHIYTSCIISLTNYFALKDITKKVILTIIIILSSLRQKLLLLPYAIYLFLFLFLFLLLFFWISWVPWKLHGRCVNQKIRTNIFDKFMGSNILNKSNNFFCLRNGIL